MKTPSRCIVELVLGSLVLATSSPALAAERAAASVGATAAESALATRASRGATCIGFGTGAAALPAGWGAATRATTEPRAAACGADGWSRELHPVEVARDGLTSIQVASLEERRPRRGRVRTLDVSFLVPGDAYATWNHSAAFAAFDDSDDRFRRVGAAAFADALYVEIVDATCGLEDHLLAPVPIPGRIVPERWYRLSADVEIRTGRSRVQVAIADLETLEMLAETSFTTECPLAWAADTKTAVAFLAEVPAAARGAAASLLVDDYFVSTTLVTKQVARARRAAP